MDVQGAAQRACPSRDWRARRKFSPWGTSGAAARALSRFGSSTHEHGTHDSQRILDSQLIPQTCPSGVCGVDAIGAKWGPTPAQAAQPIEPRRPRLTQLQPQRPLPLSTAVPCHRPTAVGVARTHLIKKLGNHFAWCLLRGAAAVPRFDHSMRCTRPASGSPRFELLLLLVARPHQMKGRGSDVIRHFILASVRIGKHSCPATPCFSCPFPCLPFRRGSNIQASIPGVQVAPRETCLVFVARARRWQQQQGGGA